MKDIFARALSFLLFTIVIFTPFSANTTENVDAIYDALILPNDTPYEFVQNHYQTISRLNTLENEKINRDNDTTHSNMKSLSFMANSKNVLVRTIAPVTEHGGGSESNGSDLFVKASDFVNNIDYRLDGSVIQEVSYRRTTDLFCVKSGTVIQYTLRTYESSFMVVAFDENKHVIVEKSVAGCNSINLVTDTYVVPDGVHYLAFSVANDYNTLNYANAWSVGNTSKIDPFDGCFNDIDIMHDDKFFMGFPATFIFKDRIFVIYRHTLGHSTIAGAHHNLFYMSSKDGIHWSKEKELILPHSDSRGLFRDYRNAFVINDGSTLHMFSQIALSTAKGIKIYRAMYSKLKVEGKFVSSIYNVMLPTWVNDSLVYELTDVQSIQKGTRSTIIGGKPCVLDDDIYLPSYYTENGRTCAYIFKWNFGHKIDGVHWRKCEAELNGYSESAIVHTDNGWIWTLRGENGNFSSTCKTMDNFHTVSIMESSNKMLCNIDMCKVNGDIILVGGRQMNSGKCAYLGILNGNGRTICDSHYSMREMYNQDSASCSIETDDNNVYVIYYYCNDKRHGIACATISKDHILIFSKK